MLFTSTRSSCSISSAEAIARGLAADGGLFVPQEFPQITAQDIAALADADYKERAKFIIGKYLTDYTSEELFRCVNGAYDGTFDHDLPAPVKEIAPGKNILELWHGPTCAFKDMALQILPYLLGTAVNKCAPGRTTVILVATSGDTGKAALDGFADVPMTRIIVFYPQDGVSDMQKLQMTTQKGSNVAVCGIEGNFDDAQSGVKEIFSDPEMQALLKSADMEFSSANSINFGRLVPQVVYYVSAYCDLVKSGRIANGTPVNVAVPTGNFGNILAAYYAKQMGLPIARFICASNSNNVLTDFINTGIYDRNRKFFTTVSPSMDILISSNLERLLYHLYDGDCAAVAALMASLKSTGKYEVSAEVKAKLQQLFYGNCCDDDATKAAIAKTFAACNYLCDTHTAVAVDVYDKFVAETGDQTPCIIASTASPYKFAPAVLEAIGGDSSGDGFEVMARLADASKTPIPAPLASLKGSEILHKNSIAKTEMAKFIRDLIAAWK